MSVSNGCLKAYYYNRETRCITMPEIRGIASAEEKEICAYGGKVQIKIGLVKF